MDNTAVLLLTIGLLAYLPAISNADCQCTLSGDPHFIGCDAKTLYDWQGTGMYSLFRTTDVELQCNLDYLRDAQGNPTERSFTAISSCRVSVSRGSCKPLTIFTGIAGGPLESHVQIGDKDMSQADAMAYFAANVPTSLGVSLAVDTSLNQLTINVSNSSQGAITFILAPYSAKISTTSAATSCSGMCGTCNGTMSQPNVQSWAKLFGADGSGAIPTILACPVPTGLNACLAMATNAPLPTSTPVPSNSVSTPVPTPSPAGNGGIASAVSVLSTPVPTIQNTPTTVPIMTTSPGSGLGNDSQPLSPAANLTTLTQFHAVNVPDDSVVPVFPVFASVPVLQKVIEQCMCGESKLRFKTDRIFAKFVENCIADKSQPGAERIAMSNMRQLQLTQLSASSNNSKPIDMNRCQAIMTKTVNTSISDIPPTQGVSYILQYTKPDIVSPKIPSLATRAIQLTGTGESCKHPTDAPLPTSPVTNAPGATNAPLPTSPVTNTTGATNAPVSTSPVTNAPGATNAPLATSPVTNTTGATNAPVSTSPVASAPGATNAPALTSPVTNAPGATNAPLPTSPVTNAPGATNAPLPTSPVTNAPGATNAPLSTSPVTSSPGATNAPVSTIPVTNTTGATNAPVSTSPVTNATGATNAPVVTSPVANATGATIAPLSTTTTPTSAPNSGSSVANINQTTTAPLTNATNATLAPTSGATTAPVTSTPTTTPTGSNVASVSQTTLPSESPMHRYRKNKPNHTPVPVNVTCAPDMANSTNATIAPLVSLAPINASSAPVNASLAPINGSLAPTNATSVSVNMTSAPLIATISSINMTTAPLGLSQANSTSIPATGIPSGGSIANLMSLLSK